jgi:hypothetical protein
LPISRSLLLIGEGPTLFGDQAKSPTAARFVVDSPLEGDGFELPVPGRETVKPPWETGLLSGKTEADLLRNRRFESSSLQRRVECEPDLVIVGFVPIPNGDLATANFDLDSAKLTMPPA